MPIHYQDGKMFMTSKWSHHQRCSYCETNNIKADRLVRGKQGCRHFRGGKTRDKRGR